MFFSSSPLALILSSLFFDILSNEFAIASAGCNPNINTANIKLTPIAAIGVAIGPIRFIHGNAISVPITPPPISFVPKSYALDNAESIVVFIEMLPFDI